MQLTSVLQHLCAYRPDWELHLQALRGKHSVRQGYCREVWHDQEPYLESIGCRRLSTGRCNSVALHYQGNTSTPKKDLSHDEAAALCQAVLDAGHVPQVLDWDRRSRLPDGQRIFNPGVHPGDLWGGFRSGDAQRIAARVSQCSLFVPCTRTPASLCRKRAR